ncbi:hypothetical protein ECTW09109_3123 [Escherichia coli TW09109]|nr:hypothetical protein ECTW09109_3123 [Escherichia coli TW09109]
MRQLTLFTKKQTTNENSIGKHTNESKEFKKENPLLCVTDLRNIFH